MSDRGTEGGETPWPEGEAAATRGAAGAQPDGPADLEGADLEGADTEGVDPQDTESLAGGQSGGIAAAAQRAGSMRGGIGRAVRAGVAGEEVSASGVFEAIGGWRGVLEATVPSLLFVVLFVLTQDARLSALVPGGLAIALIVVRLLRKQPIVSALSGVLGVGIAVIITLLTGRGVDYFLSGFIVNIAWGTGLLISILVGWPAVGLLIGVLNGDLKGWRKQPRVRLAAVWLTAMWLALFVARLAVQLPLYMSERVAALGVARIVMGVPLFAVVIVVTWFAIRRLRPSSDDSRDNNGVISGENTPSV